MRRFTLFSLLLGKWCKYPWGSVQRNPCFCTHCAWPLKLLKEKWLCEESELQNLLDCVSNFCLKLRCTCDLAKKKLSVAPSKMKPWFDKHAKSQSFSPGDQVLLLLSVPGSVLQTCYSGPHTVKKKWWSRCVT